MIINKYFLINLNAFINIEYYLANFNLLDLTTKLFFQSLYETVPGASCNNIFYIQNNKKERKKEGERTVIRGT